MSLLRGRGFHVYLTRAVEAYAHPHGFAPLGGRHHPPAAHNEFIGQKWGSPLPVPAQRGPSIGAFVGVDHNTASDVAGFCRR